MRSCPGSDIDPGFVTWWKCLARDCFHNVELTWGVFYSTKNSGTFETGTNVTDISLSSNFRKTGTLLNFRKTS